MTSNKPTPPVKKPTPKEPKKPFIRTEHLTNRPLKDNDALEQLRRDLNHAEEKTK